MVLIYDWDFIALREKFPYYRRTLFPSPKRILIGEGLLRLMGCMDLINPCSMDFLLVGSS